MNDAQAPGGAASRSGPDAPGAYRHRIGVSFGAMAALVAVTVLLHVHGTTGRVYGTGTSILAAEGPESAYAALEAQNVRGRILVLFGNYPHFKTSMDYAPVRQLSASNFIEFAAFNNIVRKIYFIIPDDAWESVTRQERVGAIRKAPGMERGLYLYNLVGIPIIATTPTSLPHLDETVVVLINQRRFDEASVGSILSQKEIRADIILLYNGA